MARMNPEVRAAEIIAAIVTDYSTGGWFACMTPGERHGWDMHESEWWLPDGWTAHDKAIAWVPRNARESAGWLAREIWISTVESKPAREVLPLREGRL